MSLNLKTDEGISILHRLIATCDVYITNMPLPLRRQLQLCYDDIAHLNESMVYASLTPYGEEGSTGTTKPSTCGVLESVRANGQDALLTRTRTGHCWHGDHPTAVSMYASIRPLCYAVNEPARAGLLIPHYWRMAFGQRLARPGRVRWCRLFEHAPSAIHGCTVRDSRWQDAAQYDPNGGAIRPDGGRARSH